MSVAEINHLTKVYKNARGIRDLSFSIEKGQVFGLLGPGGSGKTTTLKIMTGLIRPDSGDVKIFGYNPGENMEKAMRHVGCIIENPSFYPYLTARQNLELIRKLYPNCLEAAIGHILEQLGLSDYKNEKVEKFSWEMKQRLGLCMTLLSEPELLILDEPTKGLDMEGVAQALGIIKEQAKKGTTILISSHLAGEIEQICTDVAVMSDGVLLRTAKVPQVLNDYGSVENYYLMLTKKGKEIASCPQ